MKKLRILRKLNILRLSAVRAVEFRYNCLKASQGGALRACLYACVILLFSLPLVGNFGPIDTNTLASAVALVSLFLLGRLGKLPAYAALKFDALTGVLNRIGFIEALDQALHTRTKYTRTAPVVVLLVDILHFGRVNNTVGYKLGDVLLKQAAGRLISVLGPRDALARVNGDEFAIVLTSSALAYEETIKDIEDVFSEPFSPETGIEIGLSCAIGVTSAPVQGNDSETLMRNASTALNMAKKSRVLYVAYDSALSQSYSESLSIASALKSAIDNGDFVLHYQPQINIKTGKVSGVEVLIRLMHPTRGLVYPGEFIGLAEQSTQMITRLTEWTIQEGVQQLAKYRSLGYEITLSINISPFALTTSDVLSALTREVVYRSIPYQSLIVEITESSIERGPEEMSCISACLEMLGINIAIDDFGTGQSSLLYIKHMPIKQLKLDKTFVMNMLTSAADASIVRSTIELAHSLNSEVVAEGVETEDVLQALAVLGCDTAQGYLLSRPLQEPDFLTFLEARNGPQRID